jgi:diguanylate cyclase (GGDEF)-like protein/PAS domain S-box-containing protein
LRDATQRFEGAFTHAPIGMSLVNLDGSWFRVNRVLCQITGYPEEELLKKSFEELTHPDDISLGQDGMARMVSGETETWECEKRYIHADGRVIWVSLSSSVVRDEAGAPQYIVTKVSDITEPKQLRENLLHVADHDPLTNLYSRRRFEAELERHVLHLRRYGGSAALLMLDIDHFKYVNDSLGHTVGDSVIAHVGALLSSQLRETDIVARLGGDEFAVIVPRADRTRARRVAEKIVSSVEEHPFQHAGHRYLLSGSVGAVMLTRDTASAEDALVTVDIALYDAKQRGRNRAAVYSPDIREDVLEGLTWSQRLREALAHDGFALHAQPIVDLRTGQTVMHELLIRMRSDSGHLIPPHRFLGPASRFGYMPAVDRWVIKQAAKLAAASPGRRLTVNLAAKTLAEPMIVDYIVEQIERAGAAPADLVFELSEADVIANITQASGTCEMLRELGCGIALDDFGSGFSGFCYLKALKVDLLKIDGQFIRGLASNEVDRLVVHAILDVAHGMRIPTVVEFVTDEAVAEQCRQLGATYGQGFHLGRPVPLPESDVFARDDAPPQMSLR